MTWNNIKLRKIKHYDMFVLGGTACIRRLSRSNRLMDCQHGCIHSTCLSTCKPTCVVVAHLRSENILANIIAEVATLRRLVAIIIDLSRAKPSLRSPLAGTTADEESLEVRVTGTTALAVSKAGDGARAERGNSCTRYHFTAQGDPRWFSSRAWGVKAFIVKER